jgi:hypothetical protein
MGYGLRHTVLVALGLALAGCTAVAALSEHWSKRGATQEAADKNLRECAEQADLAVRTQVNIDTDIAASREIDWRADGTYDVNVQIQRDQTNALRDRLIGRCMIMRGYLIGQ